MVNQADRRRDRLVETYRKKAKHYDITSRLYPVPGYPHGAQRLRAVQALGLRAGDSVIDIACGTGLNFPLIEEAIGPGGRIVGVDLTDAMLARAQDRIERNGWSNVSLVHGDVAEFGFPTEVDAILSTYALTQVPECAEVIAHGAAALSRGGRWVVLDVKVPDSTPRCNTADLAGVLWLVSAGGGRFRGGDDSGGRGFRRAGSAGRSLELPVGHLALDDAGTRAGTAFQQLAADLSQCRGQYPGQAGGGKRPPGR